jgi:hypothetical protein
MSIDFYYIQRSGVVLFWVIVGLIILSPLIYYGINAPVFIPTPPLHIFSIFFAILAGHFLLKKYQPEYYKDTFVVLLVAYFIYLPTLFSGHVISEKYTSEFGVDYKETIELKSVERQGVFSKIPSPKLFPCRFQAKSYEVKSPKIPFYACFNIAQHEASKIKNSEKLTISGKRSLIGKTITSFD